MRELLGAPGYVRDLERLWQSLFALAIVLGYRRAWMEQVGAMLVADHALRMLYDCAPEPAGDATAVTRTMLRRARNASVVLPPPVSPLPQPGGADTGAGWIEPFSIGDLQLVRQRLAGYRLGEVARVENVMRGERLQVERRRLQRELESRASATDAEEMLETEAASTRRSLYEEMCAAVAEKSVKTIYDNFNTSYGPPTQANLSGSWTERTEPGAHPATEDAARFAHTLLSSTVGRIRRAVSQQRASSSLLHCEETVLSVIDNAAGKGPLTAVYHWVNKVYETDVVSYGRRLLVEFMLVKPAERFIREQERIEGRSFARPPTPAEQGVASFLSIEPGNYADLAALYDVTDVEPPPPASRLVSATLRGGDDALVPIPAGYRAVAAQVRCIAGDPPPVVLVGTERYDGGKEPPTRTFGQDSAIPVSVQAPAPPAAGPGAEPPPPFVNVDIECHPGEALMNEWRIRLHAAIVAGYRRQLARFLEASGGTGQPARSREANRDLERGALRRGCIELLMARSAPADDVEQAPQPRPDVPRQLQFFDSLFEWNEMSYRWYDVPGGDPAPHDAGAGEDARFAMFLAAGLARVLLPVAPEREMALLYFLSTGMLWDGDNHAAPLNAADVALVAELKEAGFRHAGAPGRIGECWEVVVPTTMQLLRDRLPLADRRAA
jgi:hypothetical protein